MAKNLGKARQALKGPRPYPSLEMSYASLLIYLYNYFRENARSQFLDIQNRVLGRLKTHRADRDLDSLDTAGCDRNLMLWLLHCCSNRPISSLKVLTGLSPRQIKTLLKNMATVGRAIEEVNGHPFGLLLLGELEAFRQFPKALSQYGALLRHAVERFGGHGEGFLRIAKGLLVDHVHKSTGTYHDREVSSLISASINAPSYDETDQKSWRHTHYRQFEGIIYNILETEVRRMTEEHFRKIRLR